MPDDALTLGKKVEEQVSNLLRPFPGMTNERRLRIAIATRRAFERSMLDGKRLGRPKGSGLKVDGAMKARIRDLDAKGLGPVAIARECGVSRMTVYTVLREGSSRRGSTNVDTAPM